MMLSKETQDKINDLFKNDNEMRTKLLNIDADAIREIGSRAQKGIPFEDVVDAYESQSPEIMEYLYKQAKRLQGYQELYNELCYAYYEEVKSSKKIIKDKNITNISTKN